MNSSLEKNKPFDPDNVYEILRFKKIPQPIGHQSNDKVFVMRLCTDALADARIAEGDWIVYKERTEANAGTLCVIATPHGETVRFYWPQADGTVKLRSANPDYPDQIWLEEEIRLRGIVTMSGRDWL